MVNIIYEFPKGYDFDNLKKVIEENLPQGCAIEEVQQGGSVGLLGKLTDKMNSVFSKGKNIGQINIKKNAYVGVSVFCTSSDGTKNDYVSVVEYVPSGFIRFLMKQVLGYVTNLIFPAIFGTHEKLSAPIDQIFMTKFEVNKLDNSFTGAIKNIGKGLGVKESSVKTDD